MSKLVGIHIWGHHESMPCIVSEKNWNTKEHKGQSMIHVLYVLQLAKKARVGTKQRQVVKKSST